MSSDEDAPCFWSVFLVFVQAITTMGFKQPTPIQKACVPVGLLGKDICACAATGTGETPVCVWFDQKAWIWRAFSVNEWVTGFDASLCVSQERLQPLCCRSWSVWSTSRERRRWRVCWFWCRPESWASRCTASPASWPSSPASARAWPWVRALLLHDYYSL